MHGVSTHSLLQLHSKQRDGLIGRHKGIAGDRDKLPVHGIADHLAALKHGITKDGADGNIRRIAPRRHPHQAIQRCQTGGIEYVPELPDEDLEYRMEVCGIEKVGVA